MRAGLTFRVFSKARAYEEALLSVGITPVALTPDTEWSLNGLDGLVLSGGTDVDPAHYGARRQDESDHPDSERDRMEMSLLRAALQRNLPLLAICRGMQLLNVTLGGGLIQHLPAAWRHRQRFAEDAAGHHRDVHAVTVLPGTRLAALTAHGERRVNSRHHQAADPDRVGQGLVVSAIADDGVIEALELSDRRFFLGVQWHPEDRICVDPQDQRLFGGFAAAMALH